jgi:hypothetical protein
VASSPLCDPILVEIKRVYGRRNRILKYSCVTTATYTLNFYQEEVNIKMDDQKLVKGRGLHWSGTSYRMYYHLIFNTLKSGRK